jgi:multiple sugar transport system ATP-binding protein
MADIRLENVNKIYPSGVKAVEDVSLHIRDGEFMILLGPSGCGKSTTLRMIAGLESISSGDIHIGGERANDVDPRDRNLAFVFQNYALYPHMTVAANLSFGLRLRHAPRDEIARRVAEAASLLGIESLLDRKPSALSGGQRQRVALGRALVRDPVAFLLDEPLSNLDAKLRAGMRRELVKLHRTLGRTIVHVTHDQVEAMTMGERICIMNEGRIVQVGSPLEVYRNPANLFVAGFLASPPMNLLKARIDLSGSQPILRCGQLALPIPDAYAIPATDTPVVLGIRPEDIYEHEIPGGIPVEVKIVAIESLGPETVVVGEIPGVAEISARIGRSFSVPIGSVQHLNLDPGEFHIFDAQTTLAFRRK